MDLLAILPAADSRSYDNHFGHSRIHIVMMIGQQYDDVTVIVRGGDVAVILCEAVRVQQLLDLHLLLK